MMEKVIGFEKWYIQIAFGWNLGLGFNIDNAGLTIVFLCCTLNIIARNGIFKTK